MATGEQILNDLNAVYEKLNPTLWYAVTEMAPPGKVLTLQPSAFFPYESHYVHPDDWARFHREMSGTFRMRDVRSWRPDGATKPTIIEGEHS